MSTEVILVSQLVMVIAIAVGMFRILKIVAPLTKMKIDDDLVASIEKVEGMTKTEFYKVVGPSFWAQVELAKKSGALPPMMTKLAYYLGLIHEAWIRYQSASDSEKPNVLASINAAGMSADDKLNKIDLAQMSFPLPQADDKGRVNIPLPPADPTRGPASM